MAYWLQQETILDIAQYSTLKFQLVVSCVNSSTLAEPQFVVADRVFFLLPALPALITTKVKQRSESRIYLA